MIHVRGISKDKEGSRWENMKNCLIFNELKMSGGGHDKSRLLTNYQNPREMAGKEFSDEKISIKFSNSVFCLNIYYWVWTGLCRIINVSCYLVHVHSSQRRCVQIIISCVLPVSGHNLWQSCLGLWLTATCCVFLSPVSQYLSHHMMEVTAVPWYKLQTNDHNK